MARTPERERLDERDAVEHGELRPAEPYEEQELVDRQGRRWYLRPADPGRYDYLGFSWAAWLVFWLVVIGLVWWAWAAAY